MDGVNVCVCVWGGMYIQRILSNQANHLQEFIEV